MSTTKSAAELWAMYAAIGEWRCDDLRRKINCMDAPWLRSFAESVMIQADLVLIEAAYLACERMKQSRPVGS